MATSSEPLRNALVVPDLHAPRIYSASLSPDLALESGGRIACSFPGASDALDISTAGDETTLDTGDLSLELRARSMTLEFGSDASLDMQSGLTLMGTLGAVFGAIQDPPEIQSAQLSWTQSATQSALVYDVDAPAGVIAASFPSDSAGISSSTFSGSASGYTVVVRVKRTQAGPATLIGSHDEAILEVDESGNARAHVRYDDGVRVDNDLGPADALLPLDTWATLAVAVGGSGSDPSLVVFSDGVESFSGGPARADQDVTLAFPEGIAIGYAGSGSAAMRARVSRALVFDRALSQADAEAVHAAIARNVLSIMDASVSTTTTGTGSTSADIGGFLLTSAGHAELRTGDTNSLSVRAPGNVDLRATQRHTISVGGNDCVTMLGDKVTFHTDVDIDGILNTISGDQIVTNVADPLIEIADKLETEAATSSGPSGISIDTVPSDAGSVAHMSRFKAADGSNLFVDGDGKVDVAKANASGVFAHRLTHVTGSGAKVSSSRTAASRLDEPAWAVQGGHVRIARVVPGSADGEVTHYTMLMRATDAGDFEVCRMTRRLLWDMESGRFTSTESPQIDVMKALVNEA